MFQENSVFYLRQYGKPSAMKRTFLILLCTVLQISGLRGRGSRNPRIMNGQKAQDGEFPYQAMVVSCQGYCGICGASIIHERWLLTAARCTFLNETNTVVTVGSIVNSEYGGKDYEIEMIIKHEKFDVSPKVPHYKHDIALIRVDTDMQFNEYIKPVKLPKNDSNMYENYLGFVTGWGITNYKDSNGYRLTKYLRYILVKILEQNKCKKLWPELTEDHICTAIDGRKSICYGDVGGPLMIGNTQVGIISFADGECGKKKPNVHTRVSKYLDWIKDRMVSYSGDSLEQEPEQESNEEPGPEQESNEEPGPEQESNEESGPEPESNKQESENDDYLATDYQL